MTDKKSKAKTSTKRLPRLLSRIFPSAAEDAKAANEPEDTGPSYRLAYRDNDFLLRDDMRAVRLQLEWLKPDVLQDEQGIESTVVIFGSARTKEPEKAAAHLKQAQKALEKTPEAAAAIKQYKAAEIAFKNSQYYTEARSLAAKISQYCHVDAQGNDENHKVVVTGGGPGIMEAANRGAADVGAKSIGLNIVLPFEQVPNPYISSELCFQFHYFAIRKLHFLLRAKALVAFPGGFGTLDELFETLTLIQTRKIVPVPVVLVGQAFWERLVDFDYMVEEGVIAAEDRELFWYAETAEDIWQGLNLWYARAVKR